MILEPIIRSAQVGVSHRRHRVAVQLRKAPAGWLRTRTFTFAKLALAALIALPITCNAASYDSAGPLLLNDIAHAFPAKAKTLYLEDASGRLRIEDLANPALKGQFRTIGSGSEAPNFGFSRSAYWLALPITLAADCPPRWLLEVGFPSLDQVEVFTPQPDDSFYKQTAGDLQPFASRLYPHRNLVFPIMLTPGATQTVYLRVVSSGSLTIPLTLWQPDTLDARDQKSYALLGLYYGMLLALLIYNLLLYFAVRDRVFLAYVGLVAAMTTAMVSLNGLGNQFLWPDWPAWGKIAFTSSMAAAGLFGAQFTRLFLDTRRDHPRLDHLLFTLAAIFAAASVTPILFDYRFAAMLTCVNGLLLAIVAICAGIYCQCKLHPDKRLPGGRYFLIAWTILLIGTALLALRSLNWIPTTDFSSYAMQVGSALEMLLLSAAMAERIQAMRRDALQSERTMVETLRHTEQGLETRVSARTRELEQANAELRATEKQLEYMARHDPLTGLPNRALLDDRLDQALARAKRSGRSIAVMLADLDRFKAINDSFGHPVGDQMLKAISSRFTDCLRSADTLARVGGDEFVIILEEIQDPSDATRVADKLIAAASRHLELPQEGRLQVGVSIGIAYFPLHASDVIALIRHADDAMYAAKAAGGNCWRTA